MLTRDRIPAPPEMTDAIRAIATDLAQATPRAISRGVLAMGFVLAVVFGAFALVDLVWGVVDRAMWFTLSLGSTIMLIPIMWSHIAGERRSGPGRAALAAELEAQAATAEVLRHELTRDARHWFVGHEHGVILVCPADADRTLYLDLSSVSDDERHDHWYKNDLLHRAQWRWFTTPDGGLQLGFDAMGAALPPNELEEAMGSYDPEIGGDLFEFLGSPGDGDVIDRPFAEVDAFLRARIPKPTAA